MPKKRRTKQNIHIKLQTKQYKLNKKHGIYKPNRSPWIPSKVVKTTPPAWTNKKLPAYVTNEYDLSYLNRKPDKEKY